MVKSRERLIWMIIVLAAVFGGMIAGGRRERGKEADQARETPVEKTGREPGGRPGHKSSRPDSVANQEDEVRKMANHALSAPSRTERYRRVMLMLDRTTAENWQALWKEYIRQTLVEGRVHEGEWSLFMNRVGEVAGPDAMEYFTYNAQNEHTFNRSQVLIGWASLDPRGALEWMKARPPEEVPDALWGSVMQGAAAKDSALAIELLSQVPEEHTSKVIRGTVDTLIQAEGLENTAKILGKMVADMPEGADMPEKLKLFYKEIRQRADRMDWLARSYPDMPKREASLDHLQSVFEPSR